MEFKKSFVQNKYFYFAIKNLILVKISNFLKFLSESIILKIEPDYVKASFGRLNSAIDETRKINITKQIHIVGNSHAHSFTGSEFSTYGRGNKEHKYWDSYSLGPMSTLDLLSIKWSLFEKLITVNNWQKQEFVLFTFGEPETRWYALRNPKILYDNFNSEDVQKILMPFIDAAKQIFIKIDKLGLQPIVWGGHCSPNRNEAGKKDIEFKGDYWIRNQMVKFWHEQMKQIASENNWLFISVVPLMLKSDGKTNTFLLNSEEDVHLRTDFLEGFLISELCRNGIIIG